MRRLGAREPRGDSVRAVRRGEEGPRRREHVLILAKITIAVSILAIAWVVAPTAGAVDFEYTAGDLVAVDTLGTLFKIQTYLTIHGTEPVRFRVTKNARISAGWTASLCVNGNCLRPDIDELPEYLALFEPGQTDTIATWFDTSVVRREGSARATLTVAPFDAPEEAVSFTMGAITRGVEVLIVDDDGGAAYDSLCSVSMPAELIPGTWLRGSAEIALEEIAGFPRVLWLTGEASPSLDAADRATISAYLAGGGEVLLSGQNIAYSLCDPASAEYSEEACEWLGETFRVAYEADDAVSTSVSGVAGDAIGGGLDFTIEGGTGAGNQASPDRIRAVTGGVVAFTYETSSAAGAGSQPAVAGVRSPAYCPATLFLGFGIEGIADATDRAALVSRAFAYMDAAPLDADSCAVLASPPVSGEILSQNRRNPFHPTGESPTTEFVIRLAPPARARLEIFDTSGRLVRTLFDGEVAARETIAEWDGADDDGESLPAGVYFARLSAGGATQTRKTILVK